MIVRIALVLTIGICKAAVQIGRAGWLRSGFDEFDPAMSTRKDIDGLSNGRNLDHEVTILWVR